MANIPTFDTPESDVFRPNESGASVVARTGMRIGAMARETGSLRLRAAAALERGFQSLGIGVEKIGKVVEAHQASTEISNGTMILADTHNAIDAAWTKARGEADPAINVGPDFLNNVVKPQLAKVVESAATPQARRHLQDMVDNAELHYVQSTHRDDMAYAGDNVIRNMQNVISTATRRSQQDVTSIDYNSQMIAQSFDGAIKSGSFDASTVIKLRNEQQKAIKENALQGVRGAIDRNPFQAVRDIDSWAQKYNMDGKEVETLKHYARAQQRAHIADANAAAWQADVATRKQSEARLQHILNGLDNVDSEVTWKNLGKSALTTQGLVSRDREFLATLAIAQQKRIEDERTGKIVRSNPMAEFEYRSRIGDPTQPLTQDDIKDAVHSPDLSKRINPDQGIKLWGELKAFDAKDAKPLDKEWLQAKNAVTTELKEDFTNGTGVIRNSYQLGAITRAVHDLYDRQRAANIKSQELGDPDSKFYYLRDPVIKELMNRDPKSFLPKNLKPTTTGGKTLPPLDLMKMLEMGKENK